MKMKTFKKVVSVAMALSVMFCASGCLKDIQQKMPIEDDGVFQYTYLKEHDWGAHEDEEAYAIVGTVAELPQILYVPPYYKGKEVRYIYFNYVNGGMFSSRVYGLSMANVQTAYIPYTCNLENAGQYHDILNSMEKWGAFPRTTYVVFCSDDGSSSSDNLSINFYVEVLDLISYEKNCEGLFVEPFIVYFSNEMYRNQIESFQRLVDVFKEVKQTYSITSNLTILRPANVAYMFNYAEAPNNNYFFINNFEYGGKIEDTPYEPLREGYTFGGWYKEAECINAWDFEEDTLPVEIKNEEGETVYQETKLYAKWIKN